MRIGVPKEIKTQEFRVGMTPAGVAILTGRGHTVLVEQGAGLGSSIPDDHYVKAGRHASSPPATRCGARPTWW
jgi:alanine dehydrogenase